MKNKPERWIAISVILCSLLLMISLGLILGRVSLPNSQRRLLVDFPSVTGINRNSPVKYAGAEVGRVHQVRVLPRKEEPTRDGRIYSVEIELELSPTLELGEDIRIAIKQDGLLGSRYIALIPGRPDAAALDDKKVLFGENPVELDDLLPMAQTLIAGLQPAILHLNSISGKIDAQLPQMMTDLDTLLNGGAGLVGSLNTPQDKAELQKTLINLAIISDNLKVVTTQAKGITATLGEKPWKLLWGGDPTKLPTEEEILKANRALPVKSAEEDVNDSEKAKSKVP